MEEILDLGYELKIYQNSIGFYVVEASHSGECLNSAEDARAEIALNRVIDEITVPSDHTWKDKLF